ncbi:SufD family Fe-S cluster assembly protein [Eubacterium sp. 1001713B170207_170306_E7]|uniref:SufB/SufD family protein n=1 Tax=Eubacterium sp. 1001713B170207_170306_E7 TaxID=2787097 RepID=UPI0018988B99|nr:SufD family Fe-S cluster assembly protein [Eubacterium sp. 1001713B170207_170306_E7]
MNQGLDMTINHLPVRTWNWLHMNNAALQQVVMDGEANLESSLPQQIIEETKTFPALEQISTGMGEDMDRLTEHSSVLPRIFKSTAGKKIKTPVKLSLSYGKNARKVNAFRLWASENSEMTVIMDCTSEDASSGLSGLQTKILAEKNATVHLVQIQRLGQDFTCLNDIGGICKEGAKIEVVQLIAGGKETYLGCAIELLGDDSVWNEDIGYLVRTEEKLDMNYVALHRGKRTQSKITASGVLRDHAFKLFRGTIDFKTGASEASGEEKEDVLLMDDTVINQTIPLILCGEEDVQGSHGATIGRLDEALMFYVESRGISQEKAYEMMAKARIDALCRKIPDDHTREQVQRYLKRY